MALGTHNMGRLWVQYMARWKKKERKGGAKGQTEWKKIWYSCSDCIKNYGHSLEIEDSMKRWSVSPFGPPI